MIKRDLLVGFGRTEDEWVFKALSGLGQRCEIDGSGVWVPLSDVEDVEGKLGYRMRQWERGGLGFMCAKAKLEGFKIL